MASEKLLWQRNQMVIYTVTDDCIMCGSCEPFCENGALIEGETRYEIDQAKCDGCGTCAEYCPVYAIVPQGQLVSSLA